METKPYISVVMPAYNVEKHIAKAIGSVQAQTEQDFEIIVVDDCSPDSCGEIAERLAAEDKRIKVIHHAVNQGLSAARNTGLRVSAGKYIWFMDTDDYVEAGLFASFKKAAAENPAEITVFGLTEDYYDEHEQLHHSIEIKPEKQTLKTQQAVRENIVLLEQQTLYGYAWNKIYDLAYLRSLQLEFEKVTLIEDILFNVKYCNQIAKMNVLPFSGYHYNKRMDNSLTAKFVPEYFQLHRRRINLLYKQHEGWDLLSIGVKKILGALYTRYIFSALQRNCDKRAEMNHRRRVDWVKSLKSDKLFQELLPYADSEANALKLMIMVLNTGSVFLITTLGRVIFVCKEKLPLVFSVIKQKR